MTPVRTTYHTLVGSAGLTPAAVGAALLANGGWQAVAAAVAIVAGLAFLLSFIRLAAAADRPGPARPAWAREMDRTPPVPAGPAAPETARERATAPAGRRVRGRLSSPPREVPARRRRGAAVSPRASNAASATTAVEDVH